MLKDYIKNNAKAIGAEIKILLLIFVVVFIAALFDQRIAGYVGKLLIGGLAFLSLAKAMKGRKITVFLAELAQSTEGRIRIWFCIVLFVGVGLFFITFTYIFWMSPAEIANGNVFRIRMFVIPIGLVFFYLAYRMHKIIHLAKMQMQLRDQSGHAPDQQL